MSYVFSRFEQLKASGSLPSPSGVALEILRLTQSDDTTVAQLSHVLKADPALAGRLVKFANSTQGGSSRPTVAISDAVKLLGFAVVRQLCLGFSVLNAHRDGRCAGFDYARYWSRSLATALAAQAFGIKVRVLAPEESFTCGLLADIGSLALASLYPDRYTEVLASGAAGDALLVAERDAFGADHLEFSAALLEDWRLPKICVDAVFHSEQPERTGFDPASRQQKLCELLSLSRRVGDYFVADMDARQGIAPVLLLRAAKVGIDVEMLAHLCDSVGENWLRWGSVLRVPTDQPPRLGADVDAAERLAAAADATLSAKAPLAAMPARTVASAPAAAPSVVPAAALPAAGSVVADAQGCEIVAGVLPDLRIHLVSDDRFSGPRLLDLLTGYGHQVTMKADAQSAMAAALADVPDLMIIDLAGDPGRVTGLCATLRETALGQQVYILGTVEPGVLIASAEGASCRFDIAPMSGPVSGPDDYLCKPVEQSLLDLRLRAARRVLHLRATARRDADDLRKLAAELAIANRRLQRAALTDAATGLPNRRYGFERLEQEWAAAVRSKRPLSCMAIEVDDFSRFSAQQGHAAADNALARVAALLRESARASDVLCRMSDDGFMMICLDADRREAVSSAERMRATVEQRFGSGSRSALRSGLLTLSIGVATRDDAVATPDGLLRLADDALVQARSEGHNRVRTAMPVPGRRDEPPVSVPRALVGR